MGEGVEGLDREPARPGLLRAWLPAAGAGALCVALLPAPLAHAKDGSSGGASTCYSSWVCVHAHSEQRSPGRGGGGAKPKSPPQHGGSSEPKQPCSVHRLPEQPPEGSSLWEGHSAKKGALYVRSCTYSAALNALSGESGAGDDVFYAKHPPKAKAVNPAEVAQDAVEKMKLGKPSISIRPKPGKKGLVGMPVWMWVKKTDTSWGPNQASASAGGVTVTAKAEVDQVVWDMGDGKSVTCSHPGTPYKPSYGKRQSPDCGYTYRTTSKGHQGGTFPVQATSTWKVSWKGGGQSGDFTLGRSAHVNLTIGEAQVLN